jgi:hypothetical protein
MLGEGPLAISAPALELKSARLPGSIFAATDIASAPISAQLRFALDLVTSVCRDAGSEPIFVARPEIFTHGPSLAWLKDRLGGARNHLSLSDGTTIRTIPGLLNHVFFYGLSRASDAKALQRLERRAPELFASLNSQINTAFSFGAEGAAAQPTPIAIGVGDDAALSEAPQLFRIAFNVESTDDSLLRTLRVGPVDTPQGLNEIEYVPLTETGLADADFVNVIGKRLARVYFDRTRGLILALPNGAPTATMETRMCAVFDALAEAKASVPLAPAPTAFFATSDLAADGIAAFAATADLLVDAAFEFWRHSPRFYGAFRAFRVHARRHGRLAQEFGQLIAALAGRELDVVWRGLDDEGRGR